jgi:hypothetical protein
MAQAGVFKPMMLILVLYFGQVRLSTLKIQRVILNMQTVYFTSHLVGYMPLTQLMVNNYGIMQILKMVKLIKVLV